MKKSFDKIFDSGSIAKVWGVTFIDGTTGKSEDIMKPSLKVGY
jgi:hypothetical protein